jgi:cysteine synthase
MRINDNILETPGNTPMVRLRRFLPQGPLLAAKIEYFNPGSSVKDRVGLALIEAGEEAGLLRPGVVEAIFCGSSSAAAAARAKQVASRVDDDAVLVTRFPDSGERYLSELDQDWLRDQGLIDEEES